MSVNAAGRCRDEIRYCSPEDQEIHAAASRDNVRRGGKNVPASVTPNGPTRSEVKREGTATAEAEALGRRAAQDKRDSFVRGNTTERLLEKGVVKLTGLAGKIYSGVKQVTEAHKLITDHAKELGKKLDEAARRDGMNLAVLSIVGSKLAPGYVKETTAGLSGSEQIAKGIHNALTGLPPAKLNQVMRSLVSSASDGVDAARSKNLNSRADLAKAMASDPAFAKRVESESAFRHGVDSMIWAAQKRSK
jgi:hypothetical protein